ncbi:ABC transporter permease [Bradyrhizobium sp. dw_411]|uniref:ABC transporter permease n=1 Tax=Bradyrhizobium sp. dw_411 TaxID=2720082 RepID=UPI001BCF8722|nr:ABC transporter permease [Bradyrhizobium sp. dw_411]
MSAQDRVDMAKPEVTTRDHGAGVGRSLLWLQNAGLPIALVVLVLFFSIRSDLFLTVQNLRNVGLQAAALAAVSCGQTIVILTSGLDLSVGATVALVSVVSALAINHFGMAAGILCGIMTGAVIGVINGILITWFRVFPFIATLAMMSVLSGLALSISGGTPITGLPPEFTSLAYTRVGGVPLPLIVSVTVLVLVFLFLHYLRLGRHMYAVGGNRQAAILSGLNVSAITVTAYAMCSLCAAVGAIILSARVGSGQPSLGGSLPLESVAAVVLGGVSLFGGRGSIFQVAVGVAFVSILSNGLNLLNVSSYTQMMIVGGTLIVAVTFDQRFVARS